MTYNGEYRSIDLDDMADLYPGEKEKVKKALEQEGMVTGENREGGAAVLFGTPTELENANNNVLEAAEQADAIHELGQMIVSSGRSLATNPELIRMQTSRAMSELNTKFLNEKKLLDHLALEQGYGILDDSKAQGHEYILYYNTGSELVRVNFNLSNCPKAYAYAQHTLSANRGYQEVHVVEELLKKCNIPVVPRSEANLEMIKNVPDLASFDDYMDKARSLLV